MVQGSQKSQDIFIDFFYGFNNRKKSLEDKSTASDVFSMNRNLKDLNLNVPTSESPVDQINLNRDTDPVQIKAFDVTSNISFTTPKNFELFSRYLTKNSFSGPTRQSQISSLRNAVSNIESEFYVLKEDIQSNTFEVQLLKESMKDIEHRHKQEITLLRSQVSDLKAENLNLKETLEKIDKSQKQQFKQIGKLEREINKLQDIHAKCQSSDQQSPVNSESEQPPSSDVIDKVSICTSNKYDVLTARSETSTNMFGSLGAKPKRLA